MARRYGAGHLEALSRRLVAVGRPSPHRWLRRRRAGPRVRHARLRRRRGRPPPRARAFTRAARRAPRRTLRRRLRLQGVPVHRGAALFAEEGLGCDVASGGELHLALRRRASRPSGSYLHGNAKSEAELRAGAGRRRRADRDRQLRRDRAARGRACAAGRRAARAAAGHARRRGETHEKILTGQADSKFGFAAGRGARAAARAVRERAGAAPGCTRTSARSCSTSSPSARAVAALATLGDFPVYDLGGGLGVRLHARPTRRRRSRTTWRTLVAAARRSGSARQAPADRAGPRAVRERGRDALHGRGVKQNVSRWSWPSTAACPTTCARCSTARATRPRRRPLRRRRRRACSSAGKHCESGDVIVRDALLDDPRPGDVIVTPGDRRLRLRDGQQLQRRAAAAGDLLHGRRRARRSVRRESFEDLTAPRRHAPSAVPRRPARPRHGRRGVRRAARRARRRRSSASPAAGPVISGVLTRSRGDFEEILADSDLIVEVIGGIEPAREYLLRAMRAGKHVVTANKQLLSQHGEELLATAREHGVQLRFEARRGGRRAGRARAGGVARGGADRAHPRDRQRHDELHPHRDGRAAATSYAEALAEAQRARLRRGRPERRRHRPRRGGEDGDPRAAGVRHAGAPRRGRYEGIEQHHRRRPGVRARARPRAEADRHRRAPRRRPLGARAPDVPLLRATRWRRSTARSTRSRSSPRRSPRSRCPARARAAGRRRARCSATSSA